MVFAPHLRLTASGSITTGASSTTEIERFSFRLNLSNPSGGADQFTESRAADYAQDMGDFFTSAGAGISSFCLLSEVKLAAILADGTYADDPIIVATAFRGGGGASLPYPTQIAHAVSLQTDRRGPTGKGRFYLPGPIGALDTSGNITEAKQGLVTTATVALIDALNNVPGIDGIAPRVVIASSKGYNTDVVSVRVGRVYDTIRSRRTSLLERYNEPVAVA